MITIFYESHAASVDNVARRASGHDDVPLHETGEAQAREMGQRSEERAWAPGQVYLLKGGQTNEVGHPQERQG